MKKCPRWAATLAALTVILTSTLAPLEGVAAPGPIQLPDDPKIYFGDPDGPTIPMLMIILLPGGLVFNVSTTVHIAAGPERIVGGGVNRVVRHD